MSTIKDEEQLCQNLKNLSIVSVNVWYFSITGFVKGGFFHGLNIVLIIKGFLELLNVIYIKLFQSDKPFTGIETRVQEYFTIFASQRLVLQPFRRLLGGAGLQSQLQSATSGHFLNYLTSYILNFFLYLVRVYLSHIGYLVSLMNFFILVFSRRWICCCSRVEGNLPLRC